MNMIELENISLSARTILEKERHNTAVLNKIQIMESLIFGLEADSGACSHYEDQTYYNDATNLHRFNSDELESHEWIFIDRLQNSDYLKKIVGEKGRPLALKFQEDGDRVFNEFKIGQEFSWECYNARTNETHKNYYRRLSSLLSKFIYENSLCLKELLGIREPIEVSKGLNKYTQRRTLRQESEEIDIIMNLTGPEFNKKVNEYFAECSAMITRGDAIDEMLEDNRPLVMRMAICRNTAVY